MARPGRGYTRPPFAPGHELRRTHGAFMPRVYEPLAGQLVEAVQADATWLRPVDGPALWSWARTEARVQLVSEWLAEHGGDLQPNGRVRSAATLLSQLEARAESLRSKLGFDPLSRAKLGRDVAGTQFDLARVMAALAEEEAAGTDTPADGLEGPHGPPAALSGPGAPDAPGPCVGPTLGPAPTVGPTLGLTSEAGGPPPAADDEVPVEGGGVNGTTPPSTGPSEPTP